MFADAQNEDYHLVAESPCVDAGTDYGGANSDIDGHSRQQDTPGELNVWGKTDIGADEYDDTTLPQMSSVNDYFDTTENHCTLGASWNGADPDSGIIAYWYAIGTTPTPPTPEEEHLLTAGWTNAGLNTYVCRTNLDLVDNTTYYWYVKAKNGGGLWSEPMVSNGVTVVPGSAGIVSPPICDPASGAYCECFGVTLRCPTGGATIRYTVSNHSSGPEPTETSGLLYDPTGVVVIDINPNTPTKVLKAKAFKSGCAPSSLITATYTLKTPEPGGTPSGPDWTCYVEQTITPPAVSGLRVSDIYEPQTLCLKWKNTHNYGFHDAFDVKRKLATDATPWNDVSLLAHTTDPLLTDTSGFVAMPPTEYLYAVRVNSGGERVPKNIYGQPAYPLCNHQTDEWHIPYIVYRWNTGPWTQISVTTKQVNASKNQTVDSRLDQREAEEIPVNFQFTDSVFRGGLFVGFANDPSRVSRSFLGFDLTPEPAGKMIWAGGMNVYYTGSFTNDTVNDCITQEGCYAIPDSQDGWTDTGDQCIDWDSTKTWIDPAKLISVVTVGPDNTRAPGYWCYWNDTFWKLIKGMYGDGTLSIGLARVNEPDFVGQTNMDDGWAYFAKHQYDESKSPRMLYAFGNAPAFPIGIELQSPTVKGGNTVHGTIWINGWAPIGTRVNLRVNNCSARVPYRIVIPAGATNAQFTVSTAEVLSDTPVQVTAYCSFDPTGCSANLTITP